MCSVLKCFVCGCAYVRGSESRRDEGHIKIKSSQRITFLDHVFSQETAEHLERVLYDSRLDSALKHH